MATPSLANVIYFFNNNLGTSEQYPPTTPFFEILTFAVYALGHFPLLSIIHRNCESMGQKADM